jgi:hypothetical protein
MKSKLVLLAWIGTLALGVSAHAATSNTKSITPNAPRSHSVAQGSSAAAAKATRPRAIPGPNAHLGGAKK